MVEFDVALKTVLSNAVVLETEHINLQDALNRVLAANTFYDLSMPPFNKSAMDGFACRMEDISNELEIVEVIYAGKKPEKQIGKNQAAKIMTGAVVPEGADCVVMKEFSEEKDGKVCFNTSKTKSNICYTGEDVKIGDLALASNTLLTPRHIPILAGAGIAKPEVYVQPKVNVFATGSELVDPAVKPEPFQIRNSNSSQMMAQLKEIGIDGNYGGIISDDFDETKLKMATAYETSDVLVLSGGVSEGDFDFIPSVIRELGFEILLTRIAVQPGKPVIFARKGKQYCFGLAGNPASSFLQFELYVKPFLFKMMGVDLEARMVKATMAGDHFRKKIDRLKFVPAFINDNMEVQPVEFHGSAHINALINANCFVLMPIGVGELKEGEKVDVRRI